MTLISMVLIAKDEEHNVEQCLASFWDDVDEVVFCDTGSTDGTIAAAKRYAAKRGEPKKLRLSKFEWCDDFAAARNHADGLATGEWLCWADLDDTVHGLATVREQLSNVPADIVALTALYEYAIDPHGNVTSQLSRERLVRRDVGEWRGTIHEVKHIDGTAFAHLPVSMCKWTHHRDHSGERPTRNVVMLEAWAEREPGNARCLQYLGTELMGLARYDEAIEAFRKHLAIDGEHADVRSQVARMLCMCLGQAEGTPRWDEIRAVCGPMLVENPCWPDTYITLAEVANDGREYAAALRWADYVIDMGVPPTSLVINPTLYTIHARMLKSTALWGLGRHDEAVGLVREVMAASPDYLGMAGMVAEWEGQLGAVNGIRSLLTIADLLAAGDELDKARGLLDCAPAAIFDHPMLTDRRVQLDRRLSMPSVFPRLPADSDLATRVARALQAQETPCLA